MTLSIESQNTQREPVSSRQDFELEFIEQNRDQDLESIKTEDLKDSKLYLTENKSRSVFNQSDYKNETTLKDLFLNETIVGQENNLTNILTIPLKLIACFVVPYNKNAFLKTRVRVLVYYLGFILVSISFFNNFVGSLFLIFFCLVITICVSIIDFRGKHSDIISLFQISMSILSAISLMRILILFVIDGISFLTFYFQINKIIISGILLSAGNTI